MAALLRGSTLHDYPLRPRQHLAGGAIFSQQARTKDVTRIPNLRGVLLRSLAQRESVVRETGRNDGGDPTEPHGSAPAPYRHAPVESDPHQMCERKDSEDDRRDERVLFLIHDASPPI